MAGYIGSKTSVTQVDGYNRTEADDEFVNDPNSVISVSGSNVGIGTSSPSEELHIYKNTTNSVDLKLENSEGSATLKANNASFYIDADNHVFRSEASSERMRIDSNGSILFNTTTLPNGSNNSMAYSNVGDEALIISSAGTGGSYMIRFMNGNGEVGSIVSSGSSTSYNTSSDYRLKTDAQPMTGASARVQALNPVNFEWIADGTRVDGFLAHEAQEVVPEAVSGTKDAMRDEEYEVTPAVLDDDGNVVTEAVMGTRSVPKYQGIDQSKLVPLLTAALQEALTKIDTMETRLAALEAV